MTVVVATHYLKTIVIIADCRVSDLNREPIHIDDVDDNLQKIYPVGNKVIVAFSCPLDGAHKIFESLRIRPLRYGKSFVAQTIIHDLTRRIKYEYGLLSQSERKDLSFILVGIEPHRVRRSRVFNEQGEEIPKPNWLPSIPEKYITTLKPQSDGSRLATDSNHMTHVLGLNKGDCDEVSRIVNILFSFSMRQPRLQAQALVSSLMLELKSRNILRIGGLFQCYLLSTEGITQLGYGSPSQYGDVDLIIEKGRYIQRNNVTGRRVPLLNIWEWWKAHKGLPLGTVGSFEDPLWQILAQKRK